MEDPVGTAALGCPAERSSPELPVTTATDIPKKPSTTSGPYSMGELMVATAAREIRDGEIVFVGMRLPLDRVCGCKENSRSQCNRSI